MHTHIESIPFQEVTLSITQYVEDLRNLYFQGRWTKQKKETPWEMPEVDISALPKNDPGQFYNFYPSQFFSFTLVYNPSLNYTSFSPSRYDWMRWQWATLPTKIITSSLQFVEFIYFSLMDYYIYVRICYIPDLLESWWYGAVLDVNVWDTFWTSIDTQFKFFRLLSTSVILLIKIRSEKYKYIEKHLYTWPIGHRPERITIRV